MGGIPLRNEGGGRATAAAAAAAAATTQATYSSIGDPSLHAAAAYSDDASGSYDSTAAASPHIDEFTLHGQTRRFDESQGGASS